MKRSQAKKGKKRGMQKEPAISKKALVIIIILSVIAVAAIITAIALSQSGSDGDPDWQEIAPEGVDEAIAERFILNYELDSKNGADYSAISTLYGKELSRIYSIFYDVESDTEVKGLSYLNARIGLETEVEPELYRAIELCQNYADKIFCLGPIFEYYNKIFESSRDSTAIIYDPAKNATAESVCFQLASYAEDENFISISLLPENHVMLTVSNEYANLMSNIGIKSYIGFGWLTDAFIVDEIANTLISNEYTNGTISAYDGFTRNLDTSNSDYSFGLYDLYRNSVYPAASISYKGAISTVTYKSYATNNIDKKYIYTYGSGDRAHRYIDKTTGIYLAACDNMLFHSKDLSCAELALATYSQYICESENKEDIEKLLDNGIGAVWCDGTNIIHTSDDISIHDLYSSNGVNYTVTK